MSTVDRPDRRTLPPLVAGQRLDRATFHERYEAMPPQVKAELIGGVVYMPSPLSLGHGGRDIHVGTWLNYYRGWTPGLFAASNATAMMDDRSEPQPDVMLFVLEEYGGQSRSIDDFLVGAPELVAEVGKTSRSIDLGAKKEDYERAGVQEYVFVGLDPDEIRWFVRRNDRFEDLAAGDNGVYRSVVFPGLWLDPSALFTGDLPGLVEVLRQGLASPEHAAFVEKLAQAREGVRAIERSTSRPRPRVRSSTA